MQNKSVLEELEEIASRISESMKVHFENPELSIAS